MTHRLTVVEGEVSVCTACGTAWESMRPMGSSCPPVPCPGDGDGPGAHRFGADGHCHACGVVDRG